MGLRAGQRCLNLLDETNQRSLLKPRPIPHLPREEPIRDGGLGNGSVSLRPLRSEAEQRNLHLTRVAPRERLECLGRALTPPHDRTSNDGDMACHETGVLRVMAEREGSLAVGGCEGENQVGHRRLLALLEVTSALLRPSCQPARFRLRLESLRGQREGKGSWASLLVKSLTAGNVQHKHCKGSSTCSWFKKDGIFPQCRSEEPSKPFAPPCCHT